MNRFFNSYFPNTTQPYNIPSTVNPYIQRPLAPITPTAIPNYPPIIQNFSIPQQTPVQNMMPNQTNILWVDNENEIQNYPCGRGWQQWFGNKNEQILYVRETDANGIVQPIVKLRYEVIEEARQEASQETKVESVAQAYEGPSRKEFDDLASSVNMLVDKLGDLLK